MQLHLLQSMPAQRPRKAMSMQAKQLNMLVKLQNMLAKPQKKLKSLQSPRPKLVGELG